MVVAGKGRPSAVLLFFEHHNSNGEDGNTKAAAATGTSRDLRCLTRSRSLAPLRWPLTQALQARLDEMQSAMMASLQPRPLEDAGSPPLPPPSPIGSPSPPRPRLGQEFIRPAGQRRPALPGSPVQTSVGCAKVVFYPPASPGAAQAQVPSALRSVTPPHVRGAAAERAEASSPWEQRKNQTIVELSRRLAAGGSPRRGDETRKDSVPSPLAQPPPLQPIQNLPGRLAPELAPGAAKPASSELPASLARGAPPAQPTGPQAGGYVLGAGFDPRRHMDAAACELPPGLTEEERSIARAVQRTKAKPQVGGRFGGRICAGACNGAPWLATCCLFSATGRVSGGWGGGGVRFTALHWMQSLFHERDCWVRGWCGLALQAWERDRNAALLRMEHERELAQAALRRQAQREAELMERIEATRAEGDARVEACGAQVPPTPSLPMVQGARQGGHVVICTWPASGRATHCCGMRMSPSWQARQRRYQLYWQVIRARDRERGARLCRNAMAAFRSVRRSARSRPSSPTALLHRRYCLASQRAQNCAASHAAWARLAKWPWLPGCCMAGGARGAASQGAGRGKPAVGPPSRRAGVCRLGQACAGKPPAAGGDAARGGAPPRPGAGGGAAGVGGSGGRGGGAPAARGKAASAHGGNHVPSRLCRLGRWHRC